MRASLCNKNIKCGYVIDWIKFEKGQAEFTIDLQGEHYYSPNYLDTCFKGSGYLWESIFEKENLLNEEVELTDNQIDHLCNQKWDCVEVGIYPIETKKHSEIKMPNMLISISTSKGTYTFNCEIQDNYFN